MTTQQTDADLIRELHMRWPYESLHRRAADRLAELVKQVEELTQPAPQTMDSRYGDDSDHKCCPDCGLCLDCEDCQCKQPAPPPNIHEVIYETTKHRHEAIYETIIQWDIGGGKRSRRELARRIERLLFAPNPPAPLALSPDLAPLWAARVNQARCSVAPTGVDEAILAVDALLRQRVQRLTDEQIAEAARNADTLWLFKNYSHSMFAFARAVEAKLIGEGS